MSSRKKKLHNLSLTTQQIQTPRHLNLHRQVLQTTTVYLQQILDQTNVSRSPGQYEEFDDDDYERFEDDNFGYYIIIYHHQQKIQQLRYNENHESFDAPCPQAIHDYFHRARDVDIYDQLSNSYIIGRKSMNQRTRLIWWLIGEFMCC